MCNPFADAFDDDELTCDEPEVVLTAEEAQARYFAERDRAIEAMT